MELRHKVIDFISVKGPSTSSAIAKSREKDSILTHVASKPPAQAKTKCPSVVRRLPSGRIVASKLLRVVWLLALFPVPASLGAMDEDGLRRLYLGADLFHIAAATQLGCEQFLTFDTKPTALAKAVGLAVKP